LELNYMARRFERGRDRRFEEPEPDWVPRTELGKQVAKGEIASIDDILSAGRPILEHQIVNALLPNLTDETLEISSTQRMTKNGRKMQFRAVVLVGDGNGHAGIGAGKAEEVRPAISTAVKDAKRNIKHIPLGCGSWECGCNTRHSLPIMVKGKNGSVEITLKPAPRGVGIVANAVMRKVLSAAGIKDAWIFARGRTRTIYNTTMAVLDALDSLNRMKYKGSWEGETAQPAVAEQAAEKKPVVEQAAEKKTEQHAEQKTTADQKTDGDVRG